MRNVTIWITGVAVLIIVGGAFFLYASDWRFNDNWTLVKAGHIKIISEPDVKVFIDNTRVGVTGADGTLSVSKVVVGSRNILVSKDGRWPWTKMVTVKSDSTREVRPFLVPSTPSAKVLTPKDADYAKAVASIKTVTLPTPAKPLTTSDKNVQVYIQDKMLSAVWKGSTENPPEPFCVEGECGPTDILKITDRGIRGVAFFGDRADTLIVAVSNGIFAVDMNAAGTQNFQPLYLGTEPLFAVKDGHTVYIKDTGFYIELSY